MLPYLRIAFAGFLLAICCSHLWSATCLTTLPPNPPFTPPAPQRTMQVGQFFWYGTEALWTMLPISGTWLGLPYSSETPKGYFQKVFWWRQGYNRKTEEKPKLIVTGRRLDGDAPSFAVSDATNAYTSDIGSAMLAGIYIAVIR